MKLNFKSLVLIIALIVIAGFIYIGFFHHTADLPPKVSIDTKNQPTLGNPNAKIQIVAFEDLKCVNCKRFNVQLFPKIYEKYIKTGQAKYIFINVAFIQGSMPAANAARCIYKQNKEAFFEFIKTVYEQQPPEDEDWATIPKLMTFAANLKNINQQKLSECIYNSPYNAWVQNNLALAVKVMGGTVATPAVYINGYAVHPLTMDRVNQIIKVIKP